MKVQVSCNRKDQCQVGCGSKLPHAHNQGCEVGCVRHGGIKGAICLPEPALVRCDTWRDCDAKNCLKWEPHEAGPTCYQGWFCPRQAVRVTCNPVPEPAAPHGPITLVGLAGKAEPVFAQIKHLADLEAKGEIRLIDIAAENRKADAERIMEENGQGDREAEAGLEEKVRAAATQALLPFENSPATYKIADAITARIMKLIGEGE